MNHDLTSYRYVVVAEGQFGPLTSKTANSAVRFIPDRVVCVLDGTQAGRTVQEVLGFGGPTPVVGTIGEALAMGPTALLVGIAPQGGQLPPEWRPLLRRVIEAGLELVSGLHFYLGLDPELSALAAERGARIVDLRRPPADLPVSTGKARGVDAYSVLTVGTDCNIGKMTAALQLRDALAARGTRVGFAATGQTGILIEGWGISVDAVVADFIGGAAERLTLQAAEGNDVVLVEGQGSLVHPGYSGVTLGLLHGSMPDAMVLCHQPTRLCPYNRNDVYAWMRLPSLAETIRIYEGMIAPLKPSSRVVAVCLNTWDLPEEEALAAVERARAETGLPATDPVRFDPAPVAETILAGAEWKRAAAGAGAAGVA
ncbi:MAG TPA: DUF1611 domain-containing protein [Longimicrobiaceae bacterium]|nr:DUF1611 domain-containing protein [Longimicrobiaceae bacterium]